MDSEDGPPLKRSKLGSDALLGSLGDFGAMSEDGGGEVLRPDLFVQGFSITPHLDSALGNPGSIFLETPTELKTGFLSGTHTQHGNVAGDGPGYSSGEGVANGDGEPARGTSNAMPPPPPRAPLGDSCGQGGSEGGTGQANSQQHQSYNGQTGTEGSAASGSGMNSLPRPPPLTIPGESNVLNTGSFSPLPGGLLNSPILDIMSASPGSQLMAMFNQLTNRTVPGQVVEGITPGSLFTPSLWPDSTRSAGGGAGGGGLGLKSILDLDVEENLSLAEAAIGNLANNVLGGKASSGSQEGRTSGGGSHDPKKPPPLTLPSANGDLLPLTSPGLAGLNLATSGANLFKGVQYDKERNIWQVLVYDSNGKSFNVVGEYTNELEALVANELLSPAQPLPGVQGLGGLTPSLLNTSRTGQTPNLQEALAQLTAGALLTSRISPNSSYSPSGALFSPNLQAWLATPRDPPAQLTLPAQQSNDSKPENKTTNFKGVRYKAEKKKWQAYILDEDEVIWLGFYDTDEEAARAHDAEARKRFGDQADVNFVDGRSAHQRAAHLGRPAPSTEMEPPAARPTPARAGRGRKPKVERAASPEISMAAHSHSEMAHLTPPTERKRRGRQASAGVAAAVAAAVAAEAGDSPVPEPDHVARKLSKYRGVIWDDKMCRWRSQVWDTTTNTNQLVGLYDDEQEAARAYDQAVMKTGRKTPLNFPASKKAQAAAADGSPAIGAKTSGGGAASAAGGHAAAPAGAAPAAPKAPKVTSQYKGVSWNSACSKWVAVLWDRELKRARHIGSFELEEDAARAYDREAIRMLGAEAGLNFRESAAQYLSEVGGAALPELAHSSKGSSQYRGVSWHERSQRWEVRVWGGGKQHFIGSFTSEVEAARAYDKAVLRLRGQDARSRSRMNFPLSEYNLDEIMNDPLVKTESKAEGGKGSRRSGRKPRKKKHEDEVGESELDEMEEDDDVHAKPLPPAAAAQQHARSQSQLLGMPSMVGMLASQTSAAFGAPGALQDGCAQPLPLLPPSAGPSGVGLDSSISDPSLLSVIPQKSTYLDQASGKWVAALVQNGSQSIVGYADTEPEASFIAQQAYVAALQSMVSEGAKAAAGSGPGHASGSGPAGLVVDVDAPQVPAPPALQVPLSPLDFSQLTSLFTPGTLTPGALASLFSPLPTTTGNQPVQLPPAQPAAPAPLQQSASMQPPQDLPGSSASGLPKDKAEASMGTDSDFADDESQGLASAAPSGAEGDLVIPGGNPTGRGRSHFRGVSWCEKVKKWRALLWDGSKQRFLGHFSTDLEAARAYDRALLEFKGAEAKTNFPASDYDGEPPPEEAASTRKPPSSQYKGVSYNKHSGKWESRLRQGGKNLYLGSFDAELDAARAYDCTALHLRGPGAVTNFPAGAYTEQDKQEAAGRLNLSMLATDELGEGGSIRKGRRSFDNPPKPSGVTVQLHYFGVVFDDPLCFQTVLYSKAELQDATDKPQKECHLKKLSQMTPIQDVSSQADQQQVLPAPKHSQMQDQQALTQPHVLSPPAIEAANSNDSHAEGYASDCQDEAAPFGLDLFHHENCTQETDPGQQNHKPCSRWESTVAWFCKVFVRLCRWGRAH